MCVCVRASVCVSDVSLQAACVPVSVGADCVLCDGGGARRSRQCEGAGRRALDVRAQDSDGRRAAHDSAATTESAPRSNIYPGALCASDSVELFLASVNF